MYMCTCVHLYVHVHMYMCACVCACAYVHVCMACTYVHVCMCMHMCVYLVKFWSHVWRDGELNWLLCVVSGELQNARYWQHINTRETCIYV